MTNEKLYTITIIYTNKDTTYPYARITATSQLVFSGYNGLKKALTCIARNYIGRRENIFYHDNNFYTVSYVNVSETLIYR